MKVATPMLIVTGIETDPGRPEEVSAELLLGGRPERMALDLSIPDFIAFAGIPEALDHHLSANRAVIDVMMRRHRGEEVTLPADLSDVVREGNEPWPLRIPDAATRAANESASAACGSRRRASRRRARPSRLVTGTRRVAVARTAGRCTRRSSTSITSGCKTRGTSQQTARPRMPIRA